MKKNISLFFVILLFMGCESSSSKKNENKIAPKKKEGIMDEYYKMKSDLEPQGYIISTDSVDKIFIDHAVTINYHEKKNSKSK